MKDNSMEMQSRRHASEKASERHHTDRHDERTRRSSHNDRARSHKVEEKRNQRESRALEKKSKKELGRDVKEHRSVKRDQNRHISPLVARRDGIHRNSPVELVVKGCRNTDSSSSSSDSENDHRIHKSNHNNRQHNKRKQKEESYEELSRRKRRIESELCALQAEEEAENNRSRYEKKKITRNKTSGERKVSTRGELHIKQERISDDERNTRDGRRNSPKRSENKSNNERKPVKTKEKPNFGLSGKLTEDTNTFNGVVIKYNEPKEARKPNKKWRLYPFKGGTPLEFIPIHRQSAYLFGRSRLIADIPIDHPSCSKQHAVLQYRLVDFEREDGTVGRRLRPYIIDLESSNGTFVNNNKIDPRRYVELIERDVVKFGFSSREYVMLHAESKDESLDDNIVEDT